MDRQETQGMLARLLSRFSRTSPQAMLIYGRRAVPAPGFSLAELEEAGISAENARHLGISVDVKRMSSLGANVDALKTHLKKTGT
ncbi:MAG: ribosomal protein L13e [Acidobacteriales bacterium]|nr:ribosomal protein L13e [Terriglobales bacterium]